MKTVLVLLFFFAGFAGYTQDPTISGSVKSEEGDEFLPGVVLELRLVATGEVFSVLTDGEGQYSFKGISSGRYHLKAAYLGHQAHHAEVLVETVGVDYNIVLVPEAIWFETVTVTGGKPPVEVEGSKQIFNIESIPAFKSTNLSEILDAIPSLEVNEMQGVVKLRGNEPTVLINGKPISRSLESVLRSLSSSEIASIEVDSSPGARYAAEGGGLVNILLKKNTEEGFNGELDLTVSNILPNGYASFNFTNSKWNLNLAPSFTYYGIDYTRRRETSFPSNLQQTTDYLTEFSYFFYDISAGVDYYIDSTNTLFLSAMVYKEGNNDDFDGFFQDSGSLGVTDFTSVLDYDVPGYTTSLGYQKEFSKPNQNLLLDLSYEYYEDNEAYDYNYVFPGETQNRRTLNGGEDFLYNAQLDYSQPLSEKSTLDIGGQYFLNTGDDFSRFFNVSINSVEEQFNEYNAYDESNQVTSGYLSFANNGDKVSTEIGLRAEHTLLELDLINQTVPSSIEQDYLELFPSAGINFQLSEQSSLSLDYGRRITRPDGLLLNPFVNELDTSKLWAGNPNLQPEFINAFELGFQNAFDKGGFYATTYYRLVSDLMRFSGTVNASNIVVVQPDNFGDSKTMGVDLNFTYSLTSWWDMNLTGNYNRILLDDSIPNLINDELNQLKGRYNFDFYLPADFTLSTSGRLTAAQDTFQGRMEESSFFAFSLDKTLFDGKGGMAIQARNPFNTDDFEVELQTADFINIYEDFVTDNPFYNLNFYYSFGGDYRARQKKQRSQAEDRGNGEDITED
ncbi:MAG: TonB-dependent receptor [Saprospiraceae bacterium]|nr:TonB-dependent receptor [Saprospiraceae bacterium]